MPIRVWKATVTGPENCLHEHTWLRPRGERKTGGQRARGQTPKRKHSPLTFQRPGTWRGRRLAGSSPERAAPVEDTVPRKDFNHTSQTEIALTGSSQGPRAKERVPNAEEEHRQAKLSLFPKADDTSREPLTYFISFNTENRLHFLG